VPKLRVCCSRRRRLLPAPGTRHRRDDAVAGDIKPRAALNDDVHQVPPSQTTGRAGSEGPPDTTLRFALEAAVNAPAGPRAILSDGLAAPRRCRRRPIRRRHSHPAPVAAAAPPRLLTMRCETVAVGATGCRSACLSRFRSEAICDRLPLVAPAGIHKCSIHSAGIADGQRASDGRAICASRVEPLHP
jgi:hypothetical protein